MFEGTANCPLGHCALNYNSGSLGLTRGGSELEVTIHITERTQDHYGPAATNVYFAGATAKLHTCLAEHTLERLHRSIPGSNLVGGAVLCLGGTVGEEIPGYPLVITPVDSNDPIQEIVLQKAIALPSGRIAYKPGKERLVPIVFIGVIDPSLTDGRRLMRWAASADATPPVLLDSTPAAGATGVDRSAPVELVFSERVGPVEENNLILLDCTNDQVVPCTLTSESGESEFSITMLPSSTLEAASIHRVILSGISDSSGNSMSVQIFKFTTGG